MTISRSFLRLIKTSVTNPASFCRLVGAAPGLFADYVKYTRQAGCTHRVPILELDFHPLDRHQSSGGGGQYFWQDLIVAKWIFEADPLKHVDIASRIDGFVAHLAVFREVEVIDIRPQPLSIPNVLFHQHDILTLPQQLIGYTPSISCLHSIEHFGLGRYGDPIDADGHIKGLNSLSMMLSPHGVLYLSTPFGPTRCHFHAQRVFSFDCLQRMFAPHFSIEKFAFIDDNGVLHTNANRTRASEASNFGCSLGCAIFALRKNL